MYKLQLAKSGICSGCETLRTLRYVISTVLADSSARRLFLVYEDPGLWPFGTERSKAGLCTFVRLSFRK